MRNLGEHGRNNFCESWLERKRKSTVRRQTERIGHVKFKSVCVAEKRSETKLFISSSLLVFYTILFVNPAPTG